MIKYEWKNVSDNYYYYNSATGKIVGLTSKIALQDIYFSVVYIGEYTFTIDDEKHLGQYVSLDYGKKVIENFWDMQHRTLLEHENSFSN